MEDGTFDTELNSGIAAFDSKNFAAAYQFLSPLANNGNPEALWRVGMMQSHGLGMIENQELGVKNFFRAAKLGHNMALHMLGVAYMLGEGVEKDLKLAIKWFKRGFDRGLQGSALSLSMIYGDLLGDSKIAEEWLNKANLMDQ